MAREMAKEMASDNPSESVELGPIEVSVMSLCLSKFRTRDGETGALANRLLRRAEKLGVARLEK